MGMHDNTYSNGQKTTQLDGDTLTYFFENGEIKAKGKYIDGMMDGKWLFYKKAGYLWQEGSFRMNKKHGSWIRYRADGSIENKAEFDDGSKNADNLTV